MYDTSMRVRLVKARMKEIQRQYEKKCLYRLSALCIMLFASLVSVLYLAAGLGKPMLLGMYGTILLHKDMGGYILVGVLSFTAAVIMTLLCIQYKERSKKRDNSFDDDAKK